MLRPFLTLFLLQVLNCRPGNSQADRSETVKLRLVNGGSPCAGRVEIHYKGWWGTVDHDLWDLRDAAVVCRELGCGAALSAPGGAHFGEGSGPIVTWNVECGGTEAALRDCVSYQWDHYSFSHSSDAGVICSDPFCRFNPRDIKKWLSALDTEKVTGPDNIPAVALKTCAPGLVMPPAKLYQYSDNTGIYPTKWKIPQCQAMTISNKKETNHVPLTSNGITIAESLTITILGVTNDHKLN
ncbi:deleted in malignant brain tumors 1 protein-like [Heptranchias perlo]|uniref:deleted in malignant brain tumors 1 protein-like n=1 Tax=Heptranchias perlo TaxID=212740 RepID=UPI00355AB62B